MKMVFTAPSVIPCDFLKSLLEEEGIESILKNEGGSSIMGRGMPVPYGPELAFAWPEVWVNDEDFKVASQIAAEYQRIHLEDQKHVEDPNEGESPTIG